MSVKTWRRRCQALASSTSGSRGSMTHVADAGVLGDREHRRPGLAAVGRLVEAAVAAGRPERALRRDVDGVRVLRVDQDLADVLGALEADVLPALAAVLALVDAVAVADAALAVVLAGADPDDVRVLRVDRDAADRVGALAVEDGRPGGPGVLGLPDAARGHGQEPALLVGRVHGDVGDAAGGDGRPDAAQREAGPGVGRPDGLGLVVLGLLVGRLRGLRAASGFAAGFACGRGPSPAPPSLRRCASGTASCAAARRLSTAAIDRIVIQEISFFTVQLQE